MQNPWAASAILVGSAVAMTGFIVGLIYLLGAAMGQAGGWLAVAIVVVGLFVLMGFVIRWLQY